jgi:pyruvate formate lyase activating enzyme
VCAENCPYQALELSGKYYTLDALFHEIEKDIPFYRRSNGGVTVGGGEPTMQPDFVTAFLKRCKEQHIHTAMESCGLAPQAIWSSIIEHLDLLYVDIKHMSEDIHKKLTGASNHQILANVQMAVQRVPVILRIPVIPGMNDDQDNLARTAQFVRNLGPNLVRIELLPLHHLGEDIYRKLDRKCLISDVNSPTEQRMSDLKIYMESFGLNVQIGG